MDLRKLALVAALAAVGAFAACTLNPQPLPPSDDRSNFGDSDASTKSDAGAFSPTPGPEDAATVPNDDSEGGTGGVDGGPDGGDGGSDAGDAGLDGG